MAVAARSSRLRATRSSLVVAALAALAAPAPAAAHSAFVGAQPEPGARVETAPAHVVLTFTEPLNAPLSRARLLSASGAAVPLAAQAASAKRLVLRPRARLAEGAYRVQWHTVSTEDGHALEGRFSFGVRVSALSGAHDIEVSPLARGGWARAALRAVFYVSLLLFAAGLLVPAMLRFRVSSWLAPPAIDGLPRVDAAAVRARAAHLVVGLGWLSVVASVAVALADTADAAGSLSVRAAGDYLLTGAAGIGRVITVLCLVLAVTLALRRRGWAAAFAGVGLWAVAVSGHASSASPRVLSILNDWLHLLSGSVWLGGIGLLVFTWTPELRRSGREAARAAVRHVLPAFGRVALPAFVLVVVTGIVSLVLQLGQLDALWQTAYGRILMVKIALVAIIATASAGHAWVLRPIIDRAPAAVPAGAERAHWRLVRGEPLFGLGVVAAVALLVTFPLPPRQLAAGEEARAAAADCEPCPLPRPAESELAVAAQAGSQLVAGWIRRGRGRLTGVVRASDYAGRPSKAPFEVLGARTTSCGVACRRFTQPARPNVRVEVRVGDRPYVASLPARWRRGEARAGRRLLRRAERAMRGLVSTREVERVTSGPGSSATTEYVLRAPDRMRFSTAAGAESVIVGERQWLRVGDEPWTASAYGSGIPFSVRRWFRWTPYATAVQVLAHRGGAAGRRTELAIMDPATPVWQRLTIDDRSGRVLREQMISNGHFMHARYSRFNDRDLRVEAPRVR